MRVRLISLEQLVDRMRAQSRIDELVPIWIRHATLALGAAVVSDAAVCAVCAVCRAGTWVTP